MFRKNITHLARIRGGAKPPQQPPSASAVAADAPPMHAATMSAPPAGGTSLEQIRQQMRAMQQEKERAKMMGSTIAGAPLPSPHQQQHAAASSSSSAVDPLLAHVVASTKVPAAIAGPSTVAASPLPLPPHYGGGGKASKRGEKAYASPFLAREAAKEESQRALGQTYRLDKTMAAFEEIFPAMGSGLMGVDPSSSSASASSQSMDKRRYLELMAHLSPIAPSPSAVDARKGSAGGGGGGASKNKKTNNNPQTIPQQRTAFVATVAEKLRRRWADIVKEEFAAFSAANANASSSASAKYPSPTTTRTSTSNGSGTPSPLQKEALLATALERLVGELSDDELLVAAKTGLIDVDALSKGVEEEGKKKGDTAADEDEEEEVATPAPTIAAAVLPADLIHSLSHAATLSEWLTDASQFVLAGQVDDDIAPLLVRAKDPSKYSTFTEEEIQKLERYESERAKGIGSASSSDAGLRKKKDLLPAGSSDANVDGDDEGSTKHVKQAHMPHSVASAASNPLIGTNPLLHRLGTLSPAISESLHVMDRTRLSALNDAAFQEALAYTNQLYQREFGRHCDRAEMKPLDGDEVRQLQRNAGRRMRVSLSRGQLDAATAKASTGSGVDGIGSSNGLGSRRRSINQRYGNTQRMEHAVDMAKAMRVLNPQSAIRPETATDIPLFFNPNRSVPPPSAAMNMDLPNQRKRGKSMQRVSAWKRNPMYSQ